MPYRSLTAPADGRRNPTVFQLFAWMDDGRVVDLNLPVDGHVSTSMGNPVRRAKVVGQPKKSRGLTLVEMLVVVAILAAMLGILLPALTRARSLAAQSTCVNNLHQLGAALDVVVRRDGGLMPRARSLATPILSSDTNPPLTVVLVGQLSATTDVFHCPGDESYLYPVCGLSYYYNFMLSGKPLAEVGQEYRRTRTLDEVPVLWDADNTIFPTLRGDVEVPRFHERRQSLFADWHVEGVSDGITPFF